MSSVSAVNSLLSGTATTTSAINISNILAADTGANTPGIDVNAAVTAALYAARAPERAWQADQATLSTQTTNLTSIQKATESLATDMQTLNTLTGPLSARTVTSSNSSILTATAATGTVAGVHTVVVTNPASTGQWYSDLETSPTASLTSGFITITPTNGQPVTIATGVGNAGDTLNNLATAINSAKTASGAGLGVTATVVSDSTGSRLAIIANSSGIAADFSISTPNFQGTTWTSADMPTGSSLGANSVTLTSGSGASLASLTVPTTSGETYAQLANAINTAVTIFNSDPANAAKGLTLNLNASAGSSANGTSLTIASSDGTTPFTINEPAVGFTQANAAQNAQLTVDGVPIQSGSNKVTGAIPGVTLNVLGTSLGAPVSLTVASDAAQVATAINQFVTDYNTAIGLVNSQFTYNAANSAQGTLASDPTVRSLQSALEQATNYVNASATGTTKVATLSDMGINMGNDGTLSVNSATLNNALVNTAEDLQMFFQGAALNGFANSMYNVLNSFVSPANGAFKVDLSSISATSAALTKQISDFESGYIASQRIQLTANFTKAEIALQQLPQQMQQLNAELGFTNNKNG